MKKRIVMICTLLISGTMAFGQDENKNSLEQMGEPVKKAYKAVEKGVVDGYKAVEKTFVDGYKSVENAFVDSEEVKGIRLFVNPAIGVEIKRFSIRAGYEYQHKVWGIDKGANKHNFKCSVAFTF
ncbi:MAG: hypothetical protein J6U84_06110 [Bacteroidales bacterium]|nr:hypothetical protein [Bacteroidales bacterium]